MSSRGGQQKTDAEKPEGHAKEKQRERSAKERKNLRWNGLGP